MCGKPAGSCPAEGGEMVKTGLKIVFSFVYRRRLGSWLGCSRHTTLTELLVSQRSEKFSWIVSLADDKEPIKDQLRSRTNKGVSTSEHLELPDFCNWWSLRNSEI